MNARIADMIIRRERGRMEGVKECLTKASFRLRPTTASWSKRGGAPIPSPIHTRRMALTAVLFVLTLALAAISAVAAQHGGMPSMNNTGGVLLSDQCVVTPSTTGSVHGLASADPLANLASDSASCEYYQLPHHTSVADLDNLCTMMPFMSACSVRDLCAAGAVPYLNASGWCKPFSLLAHVCSVDEGMSKMKGCVNYNRLLTCILLCNVTAGMVVIQCKAIVPLPNLPSTMPLNAVVKSICEEMPYISGCEKVNIDCTWPFEGC
ncbi:hypothetical protein DFJ74DRAFT_193010 [Hyaloraphidium curvatum]|nr:hypothetical protein DFJ74DRAFT_193010 [Hyaloraphidium curvatum]